VFAGSLPPATDRLNHPLPVWLVSHRSGRVRRRSTQKGGEMRLGTLLLIIIIVLLVLFLFSRRRGRL
jgi:dolichol kinase